MRALERDQQIFFLRLYLEGFGTSTRVTASSSLNSRCIILSLFSWLISIAILKASRLFLLV